MDCLRLANIELMSFPTQIVRQDEDLLLGSDSSGLDKGTAFHYEAMKGSRVGCPIIR